MEDRFVPLAVGCAVALLSALAVVLARKPVYAAAALLAHSLALAGMFGILSAAMVAVSQIVIYSGAIVVLFLFVVTLLPSGGAETRTGSGRPIAALLIGAALFATLGGVVATVTPASSTAEIGAVENIGRTLFGPLLVAFELTAPLLLVAIIGAVVIWRRYEPTARTAPRVERPADRRVKLHK